MYSVCLMVTKHYLIQSDYTDMNNLFFLDMQISWPDKDSWSIMLVDYQ